MSEGFAAVFTVAEQGSDTVAVVDEQAADTETVPVHLPAEPVLVRLLTFRSCKQHCLQAVLRNIYRISWRILQDKIICNRSYSYLLFVY